MWFHVDFNMTLAQRFTLAAQEQHAANDPTERSHVHISGLKTLQEHGESPARTHSFLLPRISGSCAMRSGADCNRAPVSPTVPQCTGAGASLPVWISGAPPTGTPHSQLKLREDELSNRSTLNDPMLLFPPLRT